MAEIHDNPPALSVTPEKFTLRLRSASFRVTLTPGERGTITKIETIP